jgi:hypothetical protein
MTIPCLFSDFINTRNSPITPSSSVWRRVPHARWLVLKTHSITFFQSASSSLSPHLQPTCMSLAGCSTVPLRFSHSDVKQSPQGITVLARTLKGGRESPMVYSRIFHIKALSELKRASQLRCESGSTNWSAILVW